MYAEPTNFLPNGINQINGDDYNLPNMTDTVSALSQQTPSKKKNGMTSNTDKAEDSEPAVESKDKMKTFIIAIIVLLFISSK